MGSEQSLGELEGDEGPVPRPPGPRDPLLVLYGAEGVGGGMQWGRELGAISQALVVGIRKGNFLFTYSWKNSPCGEGGRSSQAHTIHLVNTGLKI